jgi:pyrimidine deaminase RibD-like protein
MKLFMDNFNMNDYAQIAGRHSRFIEIATILAQTRAIGVQRHGSVIVKGGRILGKGFNDETRGRHAERCALGQGTWVNQLKGSILYVVRLRNTQKYGMSKPCDNCMKLIREYQISQIVYTTNDVNNPIILEKWP